VYKLHPSVSFVVSSYIIIQTMDLKYNSSVMKFRLCMVLAQWNYQCMEECMPSEFWIYHSYIL